MVFGDSAETGASDSEVDATAVLDALGDDVSRDILAAAADAPVSVEQLATICDVSESTVYRRLDRLSTLGLVERSSPIDAERKTAYRTTIRGLYVAVEESGIVVTPDEPPADATLATAMRLVLEAVDLQQLRYDCDDGTVDVTLALGDGDFETFLGLYADDR